MAQGQPLSNIVNVTVSLTATPAQSQNINTMLILGTSTVIDLVQRMRLYSSLAAVAADFGTTAPEYLAAALWFGQAPQPQNVNIGRWAQSAAASQLIGAPLNVTQQNIGNFTPVTSGVFYIVLNGVPYNIAPASFASCGNLNAVAAIIQTALAAQVANTTFVWASNQSNFVMTNGTTGASSTTSFISSPKAIGSAAFSTNPAANDTLTINGTAVTFVASGATGNQVNIGSSLSVTLSSLLTLLSASSDVNLSKMTYIVTGTTLYITSILTGTTGNSYTLTKSSLAITLSGSTLAGGSANDMSAILYMSASSSGAYLASGQAAETALAAVALFDNQFSNQWYGLTVLNAQDTDCVAVAGYIEAATVKHYYGCTTQEGAVLTSNDTTSLLYQLSQLAYKKTACQYSSNNAYAATSYLARILTTNFSGNNTVITEVFKNEPGVVGEFLSGTQRANILAKYGVVFTKYNNGTTIIEGGTSVSGDWTDTIIAADAFAIKLQTDVYNLLLTTPTKIPQTDAGMSMIASVLEADCIAFVNNGFLAPGVWQTTGFGAITLGSYLPKGYYIYQPPVSSQSAAQRATRVSVPFQIAAKTAGAVQSANIAVTINQ